MKKSYETPKAEKLNFDYQKAVVASGKKTCFVGGMSTTWTDSNGNQYTNSIPGDE